MKGDGRLLIVKAFDKMMILETYHGFSWMGCQTKTDRTILKIRIWSIGDQFETDRKKERELYLNCKPRNKTFLGLNL